MTSAAFEYAVVRLVPRADREEFLNVGVALYCQTHDFLGVEFHVDERRWAALDPELDVHLTQSLLRSVADTCAGSDQAGAAGRESRRVRFGWVTAPRSTVIRCGPVHGGLTDNPAASLSALVERLVR